MEEAYRQGERLGLKMKDDEKDVRQQGEKDGLGTIGASICG